MEEFTDKPTEKYIFKTTDKHIALMYMKALDMQVLIYDIKEYLRTTRKYHDDNSQLDYNTLNTICQEIFDRINDSGVNDLLK